MLMEDCDQAGCNLEFCSPMQVDLHDTLPLSSHPGNHKFRDAAEVDVDWNASPRIDRVKIFEQPSGAICDRAQGHGALIGGLFRYARSSPFLPGGLA
jgi:hypothetical protein